MTWSNTATQLWGFFRVIYDDGTEDELTLNRTLLVNTRTMGVMVTGQVFHRNGYVVSGQICQVSGVANQASQRGQCYVRALVVSDPGVVQLGAVSPNNCRAMLCQGYVYSGIDVPLGFMSEPGPAGGHGATSALTLAQPAAGADYATQILPVEAIWHLLGFHGQLVAAVAAANREFVIKIQNATPTDFGGCVASEIQTSGQTADYYGAPGVNSTGATAGIGAGAIQVGLPAHPFSHAGGSGIRISFQTFNIQGADQWAAGILFYEEWVVPS